MLASGKEALWRNQHDYLSQNVLVAINLNRTFTYLLASFEGSIYDGKVLTKAKEGGSLPILDGCFYLRDAGYTNKTYLIVPYYSV